MTVISRIQNFRHDRERNFRQSVDDDRDHKVLEIFAGTVTLLPKDPTVRAKLQATFLQKITTGGFSSIHPTLSFCSMIPRNSIVFDTVIKGDVNDLVSMLVQGLASVTDCDPDGRSLLSV
jgi:hypothetical protein